MAKVRVVDASPLILLSRVGRLDLLSFRTESLLVPAAVMREVQAGSHRDDAAARVEAIPGLIPVDDETVPERIKLWDLGSGESQVLSHGLLKPGAEVVLDDLAARRCAHALKLPAVGTLGLVLLSRQQGHLAAARPVVEDLCHAGLRLSRELMEDALARVGE